jgi:hypothetical protein
MKAETVENILWTFCIIVFLCLAARSLSISSKCDCSQCTVELKNVMFSGETHVFGVFNVSDLFEEFVDGHCALGWNPTQGYVYNV